MTCITATYLTYLGLSIFVTVWVGQKIHEYGRPFLIDVFCGNVSRADIINHLLLVGYYLVNIAFVLFFLKTRKEVTTWETAVHLLTQKFGIVLFALGVMHFWNIFKLLAVRHWVRKANGQLTIDN